MFWGGDFIKISIFWAWPLPQGGACPINTASRKRSVFSPRNFLASTPTGAHEKHPTDETLCVSSVRNFLGMAPSRREGCCLLSPLIPPSGVQKLRIQLKIQSVRLKRRVKTVRFRDAGFIVEPSIPSGWGSTRN